MKPIIHFQNSSIFKKISFLTILVVLLISTLSTALLLKQLSYSIHDKDRLLVQEAAGKINDFFQDAYNLMYNQRTLLHSTGYIADSIAATREHPADIYKPEHLKTITDYLAALTYTNSKIDDAILFTADGKNNFSYSTKSGRSVYLGYNLISLPYIADFEESSDVITAVYDSGPPYLTLSSPKDPKETITFIAKITDLNDPSSRQVLGYLMVNYSPGTISSTYSEIIEYADGDYFLIDSQDLILYSNTPEQLGKKLSPEWAPDNDIVFRNTISLSGLQVIGTVSNDQLRQKARALVYQSFLITGAGIFLIIIIVMVLDHHYAKKFRQLAVAMNRISEGDFSLKLPVHSGDEIGYLSKTINTMSSTLNEYINKNYLAETQRRTAELYALQAQIDPHFLANTIESIRMCALQNDDYEASEMLQNLGHLFRWMVEFKQNIIYLEDELEYIRTYLDLQKFRLQDRLSVHIDLPSEIYYYGIPRFTLQPIIENALSYGSPNLHPLEIDIRFFLKDSDLLIVVKDNGPGISEETLKKLNAHICGTKSCPKFGVALRNIHTRIRLLFGDSYGLSINSTYCQGTTVIVTLPAKPKEELEKYVQTTHS